ncbi:MAG: hypothetical protein ABJF11_16685 [Reichenbachiella sp.]|uniref:hypothetical protein n=1 Tax=Reichenbachiella sp. TaxID=2184521 RepID=UPI003265568A
MKKILVIILFLWNAEALMSQSNRYEAVYSHLSAIDLIAGETLYFNNYVYSDQTGKRSDLSRLIYIELLDQNGEPVYQSKMEVVNGRSSGHFYLSTNIETGNYHFVAYTRWMQNFDDYYHQPITIINPYLSQTFDTDTTQSLQVEMKVEGQKFLAGVKNKMVIRVTDTQENGMALTGRIVSKTSDFSVNVKTDTYGFFSCEITPDAAENYQLILENNQSFEFFDLPSVVSSGIQLRLFSTSDLYIVKLIAPEGTKYSQGQLAIYHQSEQVSTMPVAINTSISLEKKRLPSGLLRMVFTDSDQNLQERLIWNGPFQTMDQPLELGAYEVLNEVNASLKIPEPAALSISVEQVEQRGQSKGLEVERLIENKLAIDLPVSYYQQINTDQLDQLLIFSSWMATREYDSLVVWLPEYRSALLHGAVKDKNGLGVADQPVGLTFSGERPQLATASTDMNGSFVLAYDLNYSQDDPRIALLSGADSLVISVDPEFYQSYDAFKNPPIRMDSAKVAAVIKRSIQNQIENAYYEPAQQITTTLPYPQFDHVKSYRLAEFTRFQTIRDTFIELIAEVGISKNENKYKFRLRSKDLSNGMFAEQSTLLLLDGTLASPEDIINMSPYLVDRIDVVNRRYYFGKIIFDGVISIHTLSSDRAGVTVLGSQIPLTKIQPSEPRPILSNPSQGDARIPNYRDLLFWDPSVDHEGGDLQLSFLTSEVKGLFEIRVEGISPEGKPITRRAYFEVKRIH